MKRTKFFAAAALAAVLAVLSFGSAQAIPSGAHTVNGAGVAGPFTLVGLTASEASQTGSVLVNGTPFTISCVFVMVSGPGLHYATMFATGGGMALSISVRESAAADTLLVAPPSASGSCGSGNAGALGTGIFLIAP